MNKEMAETEKYKKPLSPRAEEFIFQMAHKTELLVLENKRLLYKLTVAEKLLDESWAIRQDLLERTGVAEQVALKACEKIATLVRCPYVSTDDDYMADALGCYVREDCENKDAYCWFKYFSLNLDEKPIGAE